MRKILILVLVMCLPLVIGCDLAKDRPASFTKKTENTAKLFDDGTYIVDTKASTLYWEAFKTAGSYMGGVSLNRAELVVQDGRPNSGSFTVDMDSITDTDIEDSALRLSLVNRLKSDNFFSVADYPTARFDITRILPYNGEGGYNYTIEGDLSLKKVTQPLTVLAKIEMNGEKMTVYGRAEIDRSKFGIVSDPLIKNVFILEMELSADRV
jgi:polyisoprenoid-binding protein YceI